MTSLRVLLVDDEAQIVRVLAKLLHRARPMWQIETTTSPAEALSLFDLPSHYDAVVSDMRMPNIDGATLLERVAEKSPRTARIVMSGHAAFDVSDQENAFAHESLGKPCSRDDVVASIERVLASLNQRTAQPPLTGNT